MRYLSGFGILLLAATPAFAGSVSDVAVEPEVVAPAPAPVPVAPPSDWTGFYAGLQFDTINGDFPLLDTSVDFDGRVYGGFFGYRTEFGSVVVGGEVDYMVGQIDLESEGIPQGTADVDSLLRIGGEVGWDLGSFLVYGTAGYANLSISDDSNDSSGGGYFFGAGADFMVTDQIVVGGEILFHRFDDFDGEDGLDIEATTFGINVAYKF